MIYTKRVEIPLSKPKLIIYIFLLLFSMVLCVWCVVDPSISGENPLLTFLIGLVSSIVFGSFLVYLLIKIFDEKPGLIITNQGITDNSSLISIGFIPWKDIIAIEEEKCEEQIAVVIKVKNPQDYLNLELNRLKKEAMLLNYGLYGAVTSINTAQLQCSHKELKSVLDTQFKDFRENDQQISN